MILHPVSRWAASGQCCASLLEPKLIMKMYVLVHLTNENYCLCIWKVCENTYNLWSHIWPSIRISSPNDKSF